MKLYSIKQFKKLLNTEAIEFEKKGGEWKKITGWFNFALSSHKAAKRMDLLKYDKVLKK